MRSFRQRYLITTLPPELQRSPLAPVIEAYDDKADKSWGCLFSWTVFSIACTAYAAYFVVSEAKSGAAMPLWLQLLPLYVLLPAAVVFLFLLRSFRKCQRIYVCAQGVMWERYNRQWGNVTDRRTVQWQQVTAVQSKKVRHYTTDRDNDMQSDRYKHTTRTLELLAPTGAPLLKLSGKYHNEFDRGEAFSWIWFAVKAIERQWCALRLPAMHQHLETAPAAQVPFYPKNDKPIILTRDGLWQGEQFIAWQNLHVEWRSKDERLALRDETQKRNVVQRVLNMKEIHVPIGQVPDGCLLVSLLQQMTGTKLTTW